MSQHEFDTLLSEIRSLRSDVREMHADHEQRIRDIERAWQRAAGAAAMVGAGSGLLSAAAIWVGKAILKGSG
jgi:hypothetical protein